jgi:competence protein ComEC
VRVRVTLREQGGLKPGDFVAATARLLPPPRAGAAGGYVFARDAFSAASARVGSQGKTSSPRRRWRLPFALRTAHR